MVVRAPLNASEAEIRRYVVAKQAWIDQALRKQQQKKELTPAFRLGGTIPYLGQPLLVESSSVRKPVLQGNALLIPQTGVPKRRVKGWLMQQAREQLPPRIAYWSKVMGLTPSSLNITNPKARWGSMKSDGSLRLNVALMHCDPALIDYVIVHELSHMVHMNHSPAFHAHVARYLPDAESRRKALKLLSGLLTLLREE